MIDRAWIQTRLTADARRDRAAFRLATDRKELIVRLPSGALADEVLVDGHRVESRLFDNDRISIPLSEHGGFQRRTVELRYRFPSGARPPRGEMTLDFPRFGRNVWVQHCYWQLVLAIGTVGRHRTAGAPARMDERLSLQCVRRHQPR